MNTSNTFKCENCNQVFEGYENEDVPELHSEDVQIVCEKCFADLMELKDK